jgi:hypothetical protein
VAWRLAAGLAIALALWRGILPADDAPPPARASASARP